MNLQLSCQKCGNNVKKTKNLINLTSEFGFKIPTFVYECEHCHEKHILCPECNGKGFDNVDDCEECSGMGVIEIERM